MLQAWVRAALGTGFTFGMTALGAATVFFMKKAPRARTERAMLGFAAGVMTAASVWSLLLPAIEREQQLGRAGWPAAAVGMVAGAAFLAGVDGLLGRLPFAKAAGRKETLLMTAITLHNIPEGMAVGLAFALAADGEGLAAAAALAAGIGIQNFPEGAAVALPLRHRGRRRAFLRGALSGAVEPVFGVLVVLAASQTQQALPWFLSAAAGAMLYVVVEELIPQAHSRGGTCAFVGGFLVMMVLDVALG